MATIMLSVHDSPALVEQALNAGAPGRVQWRWLERSAAPARWGDLRRALYQRSLPKPVAPEPQP
jgi:hypothetical protein